MEKETYISPSSQPANMYVVGNVSEQEMCRKIAALLHEELEHCGIPAHAGLSGTMYSRVAESNKLRVGLHLPIHTNACDGRVAGLRIFVNKLGGEAEKIAQAIMDTLAPITPGKSDGISAQPQLYEIYASDALCVYIEVGFHDNPEEAQWIIDHPQEIAEAIARGLCNYHGIEYGAGESAPAPEKKPAQPQQPAQTATKWYRVRKSWDDAASQLGAFLQLEHAKLACPAGYSVFDDDGKVVYSKPASAYTLEQFVKDVQKATGAAVDGVAGPETIGKTVTLSQHKNATHAAVKAVQKRLAVLGFDQVGEADGIAGPKFTAAVKAYQRANGCTPDGEITAKNKTWRKLLAME